MLYLNGKYILKSRDITLPTKVHLSQGYGFSSSHVWMWELDCEVSWALKNWCIWTVLLEKTLESPLDCKEIQPVHSERDQPWDFCGGNDAEAETPVLWPPHGKSWLIGKDWCWEGLGAGEEGDDRGWDGWMASQTRWMWVWVNSGVGDGQGGLVCRDSWGRKESDTTEQLNWTEPNMLGHVGMIFVAIFVSGWTCDKYLIN